ncbi:hypothetical protein [Faecalibacterium intestinale]|uniref:Membrane protein insertion efficiency factor YidD n=1 Tax=Faecalibacterium intestinale TaxID=3133155 RepID=A0ABV1C3P7_9FIRM
MIRIFGFSFMAMSLLLPLFRSGHAVRTDRMQRTYARHPLFLHSFILYWILQQNARLRATFLPFSGIFCKRSHSRLYKCNPIFTVPFFTVPFANVVRKQAVCRYSPSCENAVAALRRALQPRNINLISADDAQSKAERILNRPTQKEKGLLRKTRNSPF